MRHALLFASGSIALATVVACATSSSEEDARPAPPSDDAGESTVSEPERPADAGAPVEDANVQPPSSCNAVGWCATALPDTNLVLRDIWPLEEGAFALAESSTLGTKVLEWTESTKSWAYIDDDSQNAYGSGHYVGKIWAPSENELYYSTGPSLIYHGTRGSSSAPFSWESTRLEYDGPGVDPEKDTQYASQLSKKDVPSIGVWGTSAEDVYAWYANRIFRRTRVDGGATEWVPEYREAVTTTPQRSFYFLGAAGSSPDEIWFVSSGSRCTALIRRTPDGYKRVMDSCLSAGSLPELYQHFSSIWQGAAWATSVDSPRPGMAVILLADNTFIHVDMAGAGVARLNQIVTPGLGVGRGDRKLKSVWIDGEHVWLGGWGVVLDVENKLDAWAQGLGVSPPSTVPDGGATFSISSVALDGVRLDKQVYQVRGTSNDNLWAVGTGYALHKKTP